MFIMITARYWEESNIIKIYQKKEKILTKKQAMLEVL